MNKSLREKIDESIQGNILSKNLLLLCLARLNEKILFSKLRYPNAENLRNIIARTAITCNISKKVIAQEIRSISKSDHPTDKTIKSVSDLCAQNNYQYIEDFIPDKWIHHKTTTEMENDALRKPIKKKVEQDQEELHNLIAYIEKEAMPFPLTQRMVNALKSLKSKEYSYSMILKAFKQSKNDIYYGMKKGFKSNYHMFAYVLGIVRAALPAVKHYIEQQKKCNEELEQHLAESYRFSSPAEYKGKQKIIKNRYLYLWYTETKS